MSGNIGTTELQELASRVETALGDHAARETIEPLIDTFAAAIRIGKVSAVYEQEG